MVELRVLGSALVVPVLGTRSDEGPTGQARVQVVKREIPLPAEAVKECRDVGVAVCTPRVWVSLERTPLHATSHMGAAGQAEMPWSQKS